MAEIKFGTNLVTQLSSDLIDWESRYLAARFEKDKPDKDQVKVFYQVKLYLEAIANGIVFESAVVEDVENTGRVKLQDLSWTIKPKRTQV